MANYVTKIRTPRTPAEAFAYMADLRNFAEWDPGVRSAEQAVGDGGGPVAEYDVIVDAPGGGLQLRYVTTEYVEPTTVTVRASSKRFTSLDRIDVEPDGDGSIVTYHAELILNGRLEYLDRFLRPVFNRIAGRANVGLLRVLDGEQA